MNNAPKILVLSDNLYIVNALKELVKSTTANVDYKCSPVSPLLEMGIEPISIKENYASLIGEYNLIISAHCKQLFPAELVNSVRCINIHPGLNPHNRGWYPQVFSILNKQPLGATIHEIDEELDHGPIICQKEVPVYAWDTSLSAYERVQDAEMELLREWLPRIIAGDYQTYRPQTEGNLNLKKDFNALCELDLNQTQKIGDTLNLLRALTHGEYKNVYFIDKETGEIIYIKIELSKIKNDL